MERVKLRVKAEHYQIFHLSAVKGLKTVEVARMLQVNIGQVYLVRQECQRYKRPPRFPIALLRKDELHESPSLNRRGS